MRVVQPVRSLYYLESLLNKVGEKTFPDSCWQHFGFDLGRCEQYCRARLGDSVLIATLSPVSQFAWTDSVQLRKFHS